MLELALFDLDGVIRHFDESLTSSIEREHGLPSGSIADAAFSGPLISAVTTGRVSRAEWVADVAHRIGSAPAAEAWAAQRPTVDRSMLELSDRLRRGGTRTAILTNGTDTIGAEVAAEGIDTHFDAIFNSAQIGFAKPDIRAFEHVMAALAVDAARTFFTDDSPSKLAGAAALGMITHHFRAQGLLLDALRDAGARV